MGIVDGNNGVEIYIHLLDLPETAAKIQLYGPGRNRTCGPAISVERSNQLSCREKLSSSQVHVYNYIGYCQFVMIGYGY